MATWSPRIDESSFYYAAYGTSNCPSTLVHRQVVFSSRNEQKLTMYGAFSRANLTALKLVYDYRKQARFCLQVIIHGKF